MAEDEERHFLVKIPKRRHFKAVSKPYKLEKYQNVKETTAYQYREFGPLPKRNPFNFKTLKKDKGLLSYRGFLKQEKKALALYNKSIICGEKRISRYEVQDNVQAITDVDESFFKLVDGRPLFHNIPKYKSLKTDLNALLRIRHTIGMTNDCILNIEKQNRKEFTEYNESIEKYIEQKKYFSTFISEDYIKSTALLQQWAVLRHNLDNEIINLQNLGNKHCFITSKIISLYYKSKLLQKYGRFLYYLSPPVWRSEHRDFARSIEIECMGFDLGHNSENDIFSVIYENARREISDHIKPVMYYKDPEELINVFTGIEQHYAHDFNQLMHIALFLDNFILSIDVLKGTLMRECRFVLDIIDKYKNTLQFLEQRCIQLESSFYKILNGCFYENVASHEVLKLNVNLKFCFQKVSGQESENRDIVSLAKYLESFYLKYCIRLDMTKNQSVRQAIIASIKADQDAARKAEVAVKELRLSRRLEHSLLTAMTPAPDKSFCKQRSKPVCYENRITSVPAYKIKHSIAKIAPRRKNISQSKLEYLQLYTNWIETEDPEIYLQGLENTNLLR